MSKNLRKARRAKQLSQHKLGEILGINPGMLSDWELDKAVPGEKELMMLAEFFRVTPDYILGTSNDRYHKVTGEDGLELDDAEHELIKIYRALKPNGKHHLYTTALMLEKYYK